MEPLLEQGADCLGAWQGVPVGACPERTVGRTPEVKEARKGADLVAAPVHTHGVERTPVALPHEQVAGLHNPGAALLAFAAQEEVLLVVDPGQQTAAELAELAAREVLQAVAATFPEERCGPGLPLPERLWFWLCEG